MAILFKRLRQILVDSSASAGARMSLKTGVTALEYYARTPGPANLPNLRKAINLLNIALQVYTETNHPTRWATAMASLGRAHAMLPAENRTNNLEFAIDCYKAALGVFTEAETPKEWGIVLSNLAEAYCSFDSGDRTSSFDAAIECWTGVLRAFNRKTYPYQWATTVNSLGRAYLYHPRVNRENFETAIQHFNDALRVVKETSFPKEWGIALRNLGEAHCQLRTKEHVKTAIGLYNQVLRVFKEDNSPDEWAYTLEQLGVAYNDYHPGNPTEALQTAINYYEAAIRVYDKERRPTDWARIIHKLGTAHANLASLDQPEQDSQIAIGYFNEALSVFIEKEHPYQWALVMCKLGSVKTKQPQGNRTKNLEDAIICYKDALRVYTEDTFPTAWANTLNDLGDAYFQLPTGDRSHNLEVAIGHYNDALRVLTETDTPTEWCQTQDNLGVAYSILTSGDRMQNLRKAAECYENVLRVWTPEAFPKEWADTMLHLGNGYLAIPSGDRTRNLESSVDCFANSLRVYTQDNFPLECARTLNCLGVAYCELAERKGDTSVEAAIRFYTDALGLCAEDIHPEEWAMTLTNLGDAYCQLATGNRDDNLAMAIGFYKDALKVRTPDHSPHDATDTLHNLAKAYHDRGQWRELHETCRTAIQIVEGMREEASTSLEKRRLLSRYSALFDWAVITAVQLGDLTQALLYAERGKTQNMLELLSRRDVKPKGVSNTRWQAYLHRLMETHNSERLLADHNLLDAASIQTRRQLRNNLVLFRTELSDIEAEFANADPDFLSAAQPLTLDDIRSAAKKSKAVVVDFRVTTDGTFIFLIGAHDQQLSDSHVIRLPNFTHMDLVELLGQRHEGQLIGGWLWLYHKERTKWRQCVEDVTGELYSRLIAPVHKRLREIYPDAKRLILIPNKQLSLLPLHASHYTENNERIYLLDRYEISYAPSCAVLQRLIRWDGERCNRSHLFAVQNPKNDDPDLVLPFSDWEVPDVARHFLSKEVLPDDQATLDKTQDGMVKGNEILLSCHGRYDLDDPNNSHLLLANGEKLGLTEILKLDLSNTWLVVLSACETSMSDVRDHTDELDGIHTAFTIARAPTVVGSLWSVNDFSTALLMTRFHNNLYVHQMRKGAALREAQLWLRDLPEDEAKTLIESKKAELTRERLSKSDLVTPYREIGELAKEYNGKPFSHPYFWAAFQCIGAG